MQPMRTERSQLARNAVSSYAVRGLLILSALLLTPYLFRRLGADGFGTWSVMFTLTTIFNLLELGVSAGVVRNVAAARSTGDHAALGLTVRAGTLLLALTGVVAAAFACLGAAFLEPLAAEGEQDAFRVGMLVLGGAMLVRFPSVAHAATLNGFQRYDLSNLSLGLTTAGSAIGSVVAVEAGTGVLGLAVAHAVALAAGGLLYTGLLARLAPSVPLLPGRVAGADLRSLAGFSSYTLLADSMIFVGQRMDVVIIAAVRNAAAAAPYAAALKLLSGVQALTLPLIEMLMPMMSDLWARGRRDEVVRRLTLATRATLQVTLPLALGLALFAGDIVGLWLGGAAPPVTASIIVVLMAAQTITLTAFAAEKALIAVGSVRPVGVLALVEGVSNVVVSIALTFRYGALGPALGTLVTNGALAPLRFPLACRALGWPLRRFVVEAIGRPLVSSVPAVMAMLAIWALVEPGNVRAIAGPLAGVALALVVGVPQLGLHRLRATIRDRPLGEASELPSQPAGPGAFPP